MDALQYLKDLVAFESTSVLSNKPVSDYVEDAMRKQGFTTERIEYDDANGVRKVNIVGKKGDGHGGMGYFGHTDVVPADPWLFDDHGPFEPTIVGDRLYGRGSCDMKGSVACMLAAAEQFSAAELKRPIYITCTADEEIGYGGAKEVAKRSEYFREMADHDTNGIIGEPTLLEVVYGHKGTIGLRAVSRGVAAHSSTKKGLNANLAMIPFLAEMKNIHDETEADTNWQNNEFDPPTITWNIGINDHTKAVNITPPQSVCTVYFRTMPGQNPDELIERSAACAKACGIDFEVVCRGNPMYVDPKSDFIQEMLKLSGRNTPTTVSYGTDGAMLGAMKNLVVFGPGSIAQAHTHDEWIELKQLDLGTAKFAELARHWCCD
ncbi:MAG: M20 family metallopeptidase [Planctomycetota bacterium]|nr:M20 family metallopeptidase [Planctomycetota bacterium]